MFVFSRWYWITAGILIALPLLYVQVLKWIVVPIRLRRTSTLRPTGDFVPTRQEQLTPEMRDFLRAALRQFAAEGFEVAANVSQEKEALKSSHRHVQESIQVLLVNRATSDLGVALAVLAGTSRSLVIAVRSEFADGTSVATGASRTLGVFPRDRSIDSLSLPWVTDARVLCEAHRRRMAELGMSGRPRVAPPPGAELEYLEKQWEREARRVADAGDYYFDADAGTYRATWKGTFLHAWKLTEPVKTWRIRLREWRGRRAWRRLGMDRWRPPGEDDQPIPEPPDAAPPVQAEPHGELRYEPSLADGEIREHRAGGVLTVTAGTASPGQFLLTRWRSLLWLVVCMGIVALWGRILWMGYVIGRQMRARGLPAPLVLLPLRSRWAYAPVVVAFGFFAADVYKLARGLIIASRGTVRLTASPEGLTYRNVPAWRGSGHIPRADLDVLRVVLQSVGLRGRWFRLDARVRSTQRNVPLFVSKDQEALNRVAAALAEAMGIGAAPEPS